MILHEEYALYVSKQGLIKIAYIDRIVISLKIMPLKYDVELDEDELEKNRSAFSNEVYKQIQEYFEGERKNFDFNYELNGTDFQKKVWKALCSIPYGETRTYKEIAKEIGNENASRAVGAANRKNPILIAIPCHRVIGKNGKLVGFAGGLELKKKLLIIEKDNV